MSDWKVVLNYIWHFSRFILFQPIFNSKWYSYVKQGKYTTLQIVLSIYSFWSFISPHLPQMFLIIFLFYEPIQNVWTPTFTHVSDHFYPTFDQTMASISFKNVSHLFTRYAKFNFIIWTFWIISLFYMKYCWFRLYDHLPKTKKNMLNQHFYINGHDTWTKYLY